ncbi:MAG TPA: transaldolase [Gemmatimonadaceae bacterium]|jgi:transaldolase|nr:transaldolase [Gemmatimonadaceae bacterium]
MTTNRLQQLHDAGQSIWLDFIERGMLHNGELQRRIREDALTGMTSNPSIFEKALAEAHEYDAQVREADGNLTAPQLFELLSTTDVRDACDAYAGIHKATHGGDGYVSIEVSPGAAHDARASIEEARRLWQTVDRPNVMIKIPGTVEGAKAVRQLISEGINVNITLLFAIAAHDRVIDAYMAGLEDRLAAGKPIDHLASVASFFVSRVDSEVDQRLADRAATKSGAEAKAILALQGTAAVANAQLAYALYVERFQSGRWKKLAAKGGRIQRPLWASTSTKNPAYRDVKYVEELIGPDTVNTMPPATIDAFRDHGQVNRTVDADPALARRQVAAVEAAGVSMDDVTAHLLTDGLAKFEKSYDSLIAGLARKAGQMGRQLASR